MTTELPVTDSTKQARLEADLTDRNLLASRVTLAEVEANIKSVYFYTAAEGIGASYIEEPLFRLTHCAIVLQSGFIVTGENMCQSPENFREDVAQKLAKEQAIDKVWELMGYELSIKRAKAAYGSEGRHA